MTESLYLPPLSQSVPEKGYDEIKDFLLLSGVVLPVDVTPCVPNGEPMFALKINQVVIGYYESQERAREQLRRIRHYYGEGGTYTSVIVLSNL